MAYELIPTKQFQKDVKLAQKRGYDLKRLIAVLDALTAGTPLEAKYRDHALVGDYVGCRECHIQPDWLLVYRVDHGKLIIILTRTGTHSDLF